MNQCAPEWDRAYAGRRELAPVAWCAAAAGSGSALAAAASWDSYLPFTIGFLAFAMTAFLPADRRRMLGLAVYGWLSQALAAVGVALGGRDVTGMVLLGGSAAWIITPIMRSRSWHTVSVRLDYGRLMLPHALGFASSLLCGVVAGGLAGYYGPPAVMSLSLLLAGVNVIFLVLAVKRYGRESVELAVEAAAWPLYRFRVVGPGVASFPQYGPVVLIANHAAWFDPLWLGKVVPRRITPMMNSMYYDLPVIRWLMRYVVNAIRVQESNFRRSVPEIDEAVKRLDHGECLLIFPESYLRRSDGQMLRRFAQGIYRILQLRPNVPVVPCWIEGGWGSFTSHWNGPPCVGKPFDWGRQITIVIGVGECVAADTLQDKIRTRRCLEERVLELRRFLVPNKRPRISGGRSACPSAVPLSLDRKETT